MVGYRFGFCLSFVGLFFVASFVATFAGCSSNQPPTPLKKSFSPQELVEHRNNAAGLMGQFKYAEAVGVLQPLVESEQVSDDIRVDLAIALLNHRDGDDLKNSARLLETVIKTSPNNLRAHYCRGLLWFNAGEIAKAQTAFEEVVQQDPLDAYSTYYIGQCLLNLKQYEEAVTFFRKAGEIDPYLRSASYGESQALRRLKDSDGFKAAMKVFQRLSTNPRARIAELKYTRMGPKAEVKTEQAAAAPLPLPAGPIFNDAAPLSLLAKASPIKGKSNTTIADINGDGTLDLFVAQPKAASQVLLGDKESFTATDHPLAGIENVNTALWGDYDDDGLMDVYLCRNGPNQLWRQTAAGSWKEVSEQAKVQSGAFNTTDGACYDFDHDGDLDYLLVHSDGPRELFSNNRDGSFRPLAEEVGLAGNPVGSRGLIVVDLDRDDDADLIFLNDDRPHEVLLNDRLWNYHPAEGFDSFAKAEIRQAVAIDADIDGQTELYTVSENGVERWMVGDTGVWSATGISNAPASQLIAYDFNGNMDLDLAVVGNESWQIINPFTGAIAESHSLSSEANDLTLLVSDAGPELLTWLQDGSPLIWRAGTGRLPFTRIRLSGKTDRGAEMRSNASGIGVRGVARVGTHWASLPSTRTSSAAGQSLQTYALGTGGAKSIDFLRLLWPDGVSQTETHLQPGQLYPISEAQRQAGSCPLVFVWDGEHYAFVADMLGAGGIGFNLGRGEYYPPRPQESLLLPDNLLKPLNDRLIIKLGEPMEEICYFDAVRLAAHDLPPGWKMTLDERFAGMGPAPTGKPVYYQHETIPVAATNDRNENITEAIQTADGNPAPLARRDCRFIGLNEPHSVTIEFAHPIEELENPIFVFSGWVEYAYSQSAFAAWQAGEKFIEPTIQAQANDGSWHLIAERFGFPAGTSRQGSIALSKELLPSGTKRLRISSNMQIYWDQLSLVDSQPCPQAKRTEMALLTAATADVGFSTCQLFPHRRSVYDYDNRPPFGDTRHPMGYYTEFGEATPLVTATDDAVAIIGPGEELHLEFATPKTSAPSGWQRHWVLEADGWCKDADLFTQNAGTVEPLPRRPSQTPQNTEDSARDALHVKYNSRFRSGF